MVRRGSTVRVRQRALQNPRSRGFSVQADLQLQPRTEGMEPFMELSRRGVRRSRVTALVSPLNLLCGRGRRRSPPAAAPGSRARRAKRRSASCSPSAQSPADRSPASTRAPTPSPTPAAQPPNRHGRSPRQGGSERQRASKQPRGRRPRRRSRREGSGRANSTARVAPSGSRSRGSRSSFIINVAGRHWRWSEGALVRLAVALDELGFELREPTLERVAEWTARGLTGL